MSKFVYVILELGDGSRFDPSDEGDLDALADDCIHLTDGVTSAEVFSSKEDLISVLTEDA